MSAEVTDAEWKRITDACPNLTDDARPFISSFISVYRNLLEYKNWERRYDEAATLARKSAELLKRIEQYRNANVPESLLPAWDKSVEGLDELVGVLTLWAERFQKTAKMGNVELKVSRDPIRTLIGYLRLIIRLDRSKEVELLVATVLEIADPGTEKKKIRWQIRTAIEEWRQLQQHDEYFKNLERDPSFEESIKRLIPDLEA